MIDALAPLIGKTAELVKFMWVGGQILRREAVENAVADLRLEGLAPSPDVQLLFQRFIEGDLTEEQLVNAVLGR